MARSAIVIVSVSRLKSKQAEIPRNSTDVNKFNLHPFAKKNLSFSFDVWSREMAGGVVNRSRAQVVLLRKKREPGER